MSIVLEPEKVPLELSSSGVIRVAGSRVTLDTVVALFQQGASAEEIVTRFDTLDLGDVYAIIGYFLRHRDEVDSYLQEGRNARRRCDWRLRPGRECRTSANASWRGEERRREGCDDENFDGRLLEGLIALVPQLDALRVQDV